MKRVLRFLLSLPFVVAVSAIGAYALGGFVLAPWWIARELPQYLRTHLNASGTVGDIRINPFKLTAEVRDFAMTESGGTQPAIAFDRLFVNFEASSLFRRAWTFAEVTLEQPRFNLEADAKGALNLLKLAPPDAPPKAQAAAALPRLWLQKLALTKGQITFTDKAVSRLAQAKLAPVEFELRDLSTLPDQRGEYTLTARLPAGGALAWRGTISLAPISSSGQIQLKDVKLALLWQFLQDKLLIDEPAGHAALSLQYDARYVESKLDAAASGMALMINGIAVRQKGAAEPALTAGELALTGGTFSLAQRKIQFGELALRKAMVNTILDAEGKSNWTQLLAAPRDTPAATAQTKPVTGAPWQLGIDKLDVSDARLRTLDQGFVLPIVTDIARAAVRARVKTAIGAETSASIEGIAVELEDIHMTAADAGQNLFALAGASISGGTFDLAQKKFSAENLTLSKPVTAITRDAKGVIDLVTAFARKLVKPPEPAAVTAEIRTVEVLDGAIAFVDRTSVPALTLDLQSIRVSAKDVSSASGSTLPFEATLQIKQGGTLRVVGSASPEQQRASFKIDARNIALAPAAALLEQHTALKLASGVAHATGQLEWSGQGNAAGVRYTGSAGVEDFRFVGTAAGAAGAAPRSTQGATLRVQGTFSSEPQRASLKVEARHIALAPLATLVARHTTLKLVSGTAHTAGQLEWNGQGKSAGVRYAGSAVVDDFRLDQEGAGARLVAWKGLRAEGIQVDSASRLARIEDVRVSGPSGRIAIAKNRTTNFAGVMRKLAGPQSGSAATTSKRPASAPQAASDPAFNVSVERIHLNNGELDFADQSLVLPFAALIRELSGSVTGFSTQTGTRAGIKLEGRVDEFGQARIAGSINSFEPKVFTDITVSFRNVAMSPLTPYSATFAGRRIASGKLSLDLQYKLINSQLLGENKILLEQFTLGERVESPTAVNLPLDLAIALLTDADGRIDLSVPVRGNVDSPEFAYGPVLWQALRTIIANIVTAPFRALASLFGGSADKVDAISFAAGRTQLAPQEREKLTRVADVLKQRPQLRLLIEGRYDPRHDGAALRTVATSRVLAERQGIRLTGADEPEPVNFDNAKTQRAIEVLLEERAGRNSIDKFKAAHEKTTGKEVSRVNPALALIGRGSGERQFYEAMFNQVSTLQPLADETLQALATQRSVAVADFLKSSAGVDAARFNVKAAAQVSADKASEIPTALTLDIAR